MQCTPAHAFPRLSPLQAWEQGLCKAVGVSNFNAEASQLAGTEFTCTVAATAVAAAAAAAL